MVVELINTGSELMLGHVLNTHQQWLCRRLADLGYVVTRQIAVADTRHAIESCVREALGRADLVLTTGGLGPTSDDLTLDVLAPSVVAHIQQFFELRNRVMPDRARAQALVPEDAIVLPNPHGTAPGLAIEVRPNPFHAAGRSSWLVLLPGPPRELRPMFTDAVAPLLRRVLPPEGVFVCRTLRTTGLGESFVQEKIGAALQPAVDAGLELGYCARRGQVDVRLAARGAEAERLVGEAEAIVRQQLGAQIFGMDDEELETLIIRVLTERQETLGLAESCTGGCIANQLTNVPGASAVLVAGLVTYSNRAKERLLGVNAATLAQHGAVSAAVAREMAEGARRQTQAHYALSATGIAGPSGRTHAKPVGTVFIALAGPFDTVVEHNFNPYDRETFKQVTATGSGSVETNNPGLEVTVTNRTAFNLATLLKTVATSV